MHFLVIRLFYFQKFINLFKEANHVANQPGGYTDLAPLMGDTFDLEHHSGYVIKRFVFFIQMTFQLALIA